ncbi:hypothetical protein L1987_02004 [Smallanthus sonchifolius]|uniref:Uncharacterized protein n=1 Tax=Smallanthus sonchifolius TaxID=185202 RepID=A0ACB9K6V2_9ASTR|nr:hypothetical protein L1987_02004 [Smallanthus sonchifolius]
MQLIDGDEGERKWIFKNSNKESVDRVLESKLNELSGQHHDFLDTLPANVRQRVGVLKDLKILNLFVFIVPAIYWIDFKISYVSKLVL